MGEPDSPADCALAIAVPLTREAFLDDARNPRKDFVRRWTGQYTGYPIEHLWQDYRRTAERVRIVADEAASAGVLVSTPTTLAEWAALTRKRRVTTLFAHSLDDEGVAVEFADGIAPVEDMCTALDPGIAGLIDLTVCCSARAIAPIKRARPRCQILGNREPAKLGLRITVYRYVIQLLRSHPISYVDAMAAIHLAALEE